ncbi:hypothetical protein MAR_019102 [Mya arenaria]|uniref:Uncharacterized protein n=1 Tax=Mya arenaria TaxID=6604 RepID=A0ABY7EJF3_MYAAR|nr:hypothetical protein MAR_019102 [Mya arenaria]
MYDMFANVTDERLIGRDVSVLCKWEKKVDKTWGEVADAVNAVGNGPRTVVQVKTKKAKTDYTAEQTSLGKTGGGPALPEMST